MDIFVRQERALTAAARAECAHVSPWEGRIERAVKEAVCQWKHENACF